MGLGRETLVGDLEGESPRDLSEVRLQEAQGGSSHECQNRQIPSLGPVGPQMSLLQAKGFKVVSCPKTQVIFTQENPRRVNEQKEDSL